MFLFGKDAVSLRSCQKWFEKFGSGNFSVEDSSRTGRATEINTDRIKVLLDAVRTAYSGTPPTCTYIGHIAASPIYGPA